DAFFAQFNKVDLLQHVVVVYQDKQVVGCGAMKDQEGKMELKRMVVPEKFRNQGIASKILKELESWAKEIGYNRTILETGKHMEDAVGLYQKNGYQIILNYGQYADVESSVCMEKILQKKRGCLLRHPLSFYTNYAFSLLKYFSLINSKTMGNTETKIIPMTILEKFLATHSICPKKYPASVTPNTQMRPPKKL